MKVTKIIGENGAMPQLCKGGACPSAIFASNGNAYLQGYTLEEEEARELTAPQGEAFVRIPLSTLKLIAGHVTKS